jgi:heme/copper-type cytochrome/quinol oxidase subunit 1
MILPTFGIASTIIPVFARKALFGYSSMVYATYTGRAVFILVVTTNVN